MTEKVVFLSISRVIDPKTGIHYLDAIDEDGIHWMAQMDHKTEPHLCFIREWRKDPQQPRIYD
jgi:hypothetical protein